MTIQVKTFLGNIRVLDSVLHSLKLGLEATMPAPVTGEKPN